VFRLPISQDTTPQQCGANAFDIIVISIFYVQHLHTHQHGDVRFSNAVFMRQRYAKATAVSFP
jgi:hypothetical protein